SRRCGPSPLSGATVITGPASTAGIEMRYRFLTLFIALLATMLIYPVLRGPGGSVFAANLLITAICAAGARVMLGETRRGALKMLLAAPPALGVWFGYFA